MDIFHKYYKCDYPKSPQVKDGLKRLLNERYRDDVNSFKDHFVHPTQSLLSSLEDKAQYNFALINHFFLLFYTVVGMNFGIMVNNVHSVMICRG